MLGDSYHSSLMFAQPIKAFFGPFFTCSELIIETLEQGVKYVKS